MSAPFADLGEAAVCARVAIAMLRLLCKDKTMRSLTPSVLIGIASAKLDHAAFRSLRSCFLSLNACILGGGTSKQWLTGVIYRDMMGYTIRRCLSESYKAPRRDPRVTNRGVGRRALAGQTAQPQRIEGHIETRAGDD